MRVVNVEYDGNMNPISVTCEDDGDMCTFEAAQRGHWEDDPYSWICSECHKYFMIEQGDGDMNYCPHCGAKMY